MSNPADSAGSLEDRRDFIVSDGSGAKFFVKKLSQDVHLVKEHFIRVDACCAVYVIQSEAETLIIDAGYGIGDLHEALEQAGLWSRQKIMVVVTHPHGDHIGGLKHLEAAGAQIHTSVKAAPVVENADHREALFCVPDCYVRKPPRFRARKHKLSPVKVTSTLKDGDVFKVGQREFKVLEIPGHSPYCIGILDILSGEFFCGDVFHPKIIFDCWPHSSREDYVDSVKRVKLIAESGGIKKVYAGHVFEGDPDSFDAGVLVEICDKYLSRGKRRCVRASLSLFVTLFTCGNSWCPVKNAGGRYFCC